VFGPIWGLLGLLQHQRYLNSSEFRFISLNLYKNGCKKKKKPYKNGKLHLYIVVTSDEQPWI